MFAESQDINAILGKSSYFEDNIISTEEVVFCYVSGADHAI